MKTSAAVLFEGGKPFEIVELDLEGPREGEVLIRYVAAGLCHSDLHLTDGDLVPRFPIVGGIRRICGDRICGFTGTNAAMT